MTQSEHVRWCITQLPFTPAEMTVWWFLTGKREWDVYESFRFSAYCFWRGKGRGK